MIKTNKDKLLITEILGEITHPVIRTDLAYTTTWNGKSKLGIGMGSIKYNVKIGDSCFGWAEGENVEPGVAIDRAVKEPSQPAAEAQAFRILASIGNEAIVVSGEAKGAKGVVIGKHGYIPGTEGLVGGHHVLVSFKDEDLEKLAIGDKVAVKACGVGLKIEEFEDVKVLNIDPGLLEHMGIEIEDGKLIVPVVMEIPGYLMGSGIGFTPTTEPIDYDIQTTCPEVVEELGLKKLRLGDVVAMKDQACIYGRGRHRGALTIGVIIHGFSDIAGHGPGVNPILSSIDGKIKPRIDPNANIVLYLGREKL